MLRNVLRTCFIFALAGCAAPVDDAGEDGEVSGDAVTAVTVKSCSDTTVTSALTKINNLRNSMSYDRSNPLNTANPVQCDQAMMKAATYHTAYNAYCENSLNHMECPAGSTTCTQTTCEAQRFYGTGFSPRLTTAGFTGTPKAETMAPTSDISSAIDQWMNTPFHRLPFQDYRLNRVGFGSMAKSGGTTGVTTSTMDFGALSPKTTVANTNVAAIWPTNGATAVLKTFRCGSEVPDPCSYFSVASGTLVGYPISYVRPASDLTVSTHEIRSGSATGTLISHYYIDSNVKDKNGYAAVTSNQFILLPKAGLAASTKYYVKMSGTLKGTTTTVTASWSFTTGS